MEKLAICFFFGVLIGSFFTASYWLGVYREDLGRLINVIKEKL